MSLINECIETESLPSANWYPTLIAHKGFLYSIGGTGDYVNGYLNVYYAPINTNGSLGQWIETTSLPANEYFWGAACVWNDKLYFFKRGDDAAAEFIVYYTEINTDGSLGEWKAQFTPERGYHTSVIIKGFIYMIGGSTIGGGIQDKVTQYAQINSDGSIGEWKTATGYLSYKHVVNCGISSDGEYIYVVGGQNESSEARVERAKPETNGDILEWEEQIAISEDTMLFQHSVIHHNSKIFAISGRPDYPGLPVGWTGEDIRYTQIGSNGIIDDWITIPSYEASVICPVTHWNGFLYEAGGISKSTLTVTDKVYYTAIEDKVSSGGEYSGYREEEGVKTYKQKFKGKVKKIRRNFSSRPLQRIF